jgi:hypothetical protein
MVGLNDPPVARIIAYLCTLSPAQQAKLLLELDRKRLKGEEVPGSDPMVRELRRIVRCTRVSSERIPSPSRLFFDPVEPFLSGDAADRLRRGRIARASLAAIWSWICRDAMVGEAKAYSDRARNAVLAGDMPAAAQLARSFQDRVVNLIGRARIVMGGAEEVRERLVAYGGPLRALDDLQEILRILKLRHVLEEAMAPLPARLPSFREDAEKAWRALDPLYAERRDAWFYALLILMSRLSARWQLVRLAIAAVQSNSAIRIAESPYGLAVSLVLHDLEDMAGRMRRALKSGWSASADETLWDFQDADAGVSAELDFTGETRWAPQLAKIRDGVAQLLRAELAVVPDRLALALTSCTAARRSAKVAAATGIDAATAGLTFVSALQSHASHFGLDADIARMRARASAELERATGSLLARIRSGRDADRIDCRPQVEIVAGLAGVLLGAGYAADFMRAAEGKFDGARPAAAGRPEP